MPAGTRVFTIDTLPANTAGFSFSLGRDASWQIGSGILFDLLLEFSSDGVTFNKWLEHTENVSAPPLRKDGSTATTFDMRGTWPGIADAQNNRVAVPAGSLRITLTVPNTFTVASVAMSVA